MSVRSTCLIVLVNTVLLISCLLSINYLERSFKFFNYNCVCIYIYIFLFVQFMLQVFWSSVRCLHTGDHNVFLMNWPCCHDARSPFNVGNIPFFFCLKSTSSDINAPTSASFRVAISWHISFSTLWLWTSLCFPIFQVGFWDLPGGPLVKTLPSNVGVQFDPWLGSWNPTCLLAKHTHTHTKQEQYCNKFNKDLKKWPTLKKKALKKYQKMSSDGKY